MSAIVISLLLGTSTGCQDGPLYALKVANPYYSLHTWRKDEAIGVTDHQRRKELTVLAKTAKQLPSDKQQFWMPHLQEIMQNDASAEMRRLAVQAAGAMEIGEAKGVIERGLDDESVKVRMEACRALGRRTGIEAARSLVAVVGTETNVDVKHAALDALANHQDPIAVETLKVALSDRDPATRNLAVESLRDATGKDYGDDPQVWIAALNGEEVQKQPTRFAERLRELF